MVQFVQIIEFRYFYLIHQLFVHFIDHSETDHLRDSNGKLREDLHLLSLVIEQFCLFALNVLELASDSRVSQSDQAPFKEVK
jgi:hypothetical protein